MRYKTLFRLGQKLVGLLIFGQGAGSLVSVLAMYAMWYRSSAFGAVVSAGEWYPSLLQPMVEVGIGLYFFFGGRWIADMAIPGNKPYCHECGYDLTGAVGDACTECGTGFRNRAESHPAAS
jgi:hypothetical protein